jgi:hypothetical protein
MKLTEYYQLLKENEEKIPVIDAITELHPGMGTQLGWSWYEGGMRDTGGWKVENLLLIDLYTLKRQLSIWSSEEETSRKKAIEWANKSQEERQQEIRKAVDNWWKEVQNKMIWGNI